MYATTERLLHISAYLPRIILIFCKAEVQGLAYSRVPVLHKKRTPETITKYAYFMQKAHHLTFTVSSKQHV